MSVVVSLCVFAVRYFHKPIDRITMSAKPKMVKLCARTTAPLFGTSMEVVGVDWNSFVLVSTVLEVVVIADSVVVDDIVDETVCCTFPTLIEM